MTEYVTKDSGERAQFDSGMQRDTEAGKARFDLLHPLGVPYEEQFLTRVAKLLGRGAEKYDARNWEMANSEDELARFKSSAARHFEQWLTGESDEDHAAAVVFNLLAHETTAYKVAAAERDSNALEGRFDHFPSDVDVSPYLDALAAAVGDLAKITATPPIYMEVEEALPHLFDRDGDVWQQVDEKRWLLAVYRDKVCSDYEEPEEILLDDLLEEYGVEEVDEEDDPEPLFDRWVKEYDVEHPPRSILTDQWQDVGYTTAPVVIGVDWRDPAPRTQEFVDEARREAVSHFILGEDGVPRVNVPYPRMSLQDTGSDGASVMRAMQDSVNQAVRAMVLAENYGWAVKLQDVSFVSAPDGGVTDIRQMVQDALNRRA